LRSKTDMTKGILYITFTLISCISIAQQRYISSAIIAFSGGAYERTIKDINTALESEATLTADEKAKAYFYRGIATKQLALANRDSEHILTNPFLKAYNDLIKVQSFDLQIWSVRALKEMPELFDGLITHANDAIKEQEQSTDVAVQINFLNRAINHLNAAQVIREDFEVILLLGKVYKNLGELYSQTDKSRTTANFRASLRYLELALKSKSDCSDCLDNLILVSENLGEAEKVTQYQDARNALGN
jgi:tetratricopeptide (TPR) repeat protein